MYIHIKYIYIYVDIKVKQRETQHVNKTDLFHVSGLTSSGESN